MLADRRKGERCLVYYGFIPMDVGWKDLTEGTLQVVDSAGLTGPLFLRRSFEDYYCNAVCVHLHSYDCQETSGKRLHWLSRLS